MGLAARPRTGVSTSGSGNCGERRRFEPDAEFAVLYEVCSRGPPRRLRPVHGRTRESRSRAARRSGRETGWENRSPTVGRCAGGETGPGRGRWPQSRRRRSRKAGRHLRLKPGSERKSKYRKKGRGAGLFPVSTGPRGAGLYSARRGRRSLTSGIRWRKRLRRPSVHFMELLGQRASRLGSRPRRTWSNEPAALAWSTEASTCLRNEGGCAARIISAIGLTPRSAFHKATGWSSATGAHGGESLSDILGAGGRAASSSPQRAFWRLGAVLHLGVGLLVPRRCLSAIHRASDRWAWLAN